MFDFLSTKKTIDDARDQFHQMGRDLGALENEIRSTRAAAPAKSDVVALARQWALSPATDFDRALEKQLRDHYAREGAQSFRFGLCTLLEDGFGRLTAAQIDAVLKMVAGPALAQAMEAAVERVEFSDAYGLPAEQRVKKLAKLQAEHLALNAKIKQLERDCDDSGVDLT